MKKAVTTVLAILLMGAAIFYFVTFFAYIPSNKFFSFPVPKNAKLVKGKERVNIYDWSKASEENGIPSGYKLVIKSKGWKERNREGASTYYEKGNKIIDLISQTDKLTLIKDKD
ncbi:hypothetical protein [Priestia megaterium]|uniref:Uncharacterized protein n=3 Tax=Priestia megaterium TaxID=1404 RepID=A0A6M6DPC3_PRIMG|nr:hypothetical protein [Priestia megaterium]HWL24241.1 hypothetical protein [Ureibacillus sp.]MCE4088081.1 hypothetical protein [Priestia megaterium]PAK54818.1 hypothetical protein CHH47_00600 [Priestia megaterium]QJX76232.1 hypothetical protein FDZ14_08460 [Priestia megaterium]UKJ79399.1 hypothetical protein H1W83_19745 [Priestia megaterium]